MVSSSSSLSLSLTSPSLSGNWEFDVFPSFHGPDVRKSFLSHILKEFKRKAINLFIDNDIKRGEFIGPELKRAIRASKIAVVLLSKNYASSSWCLDELVEIMKEESGQTVITIFYDVDPTDIRKQTEHFGKVFNKICEGKDNEKIQTWRRALEDVATIAGYHSSKWDNEASMIDKIAVDISDRLNRFTPSRDFENFIGLENHMERMKPLLRLDLNDVRMIGILGPPGIGKTTIVRFLFSKLSSRFQNSAFMEDIKCSYPYPKLCFDEYKAKLQLQNEMLSKMFNQNDIVVSHLGVAQQRLRNISVFLILDDVDRLAQLDALAGNVKWFGPGSRIIITTEDRGLLEKIRIKHIYKVDFPSFNKALQIFCMYAFQKKFPENGFDDLASEITCLVGKLPLGLKVMGSHFRGLCKERWSMEVSRLRTNLNRDIENILKFSYDALCDEDKDLFLQVACFFSGSDLSNIEKFLAPRFKDLRQKLYGLEEKSLIAIIDDAEEYIDMHKLLVQLGKKIVREELVRESRNHQFLNDYRDAFQILTGKKMTMNEDGLFHDRRLTVVYDSGHPIIISWMGFPFTCLDFINNLEFLVELDLRNSKLEKLWDGTKLLPNLKILNLFTSSDLKELPNLSMATNLENLNLYRCSSLVSLPQLPESLSYLYAGDCASLETLDCSFGNSLNQLDFSKCFNLNKEARDLIIHTSAHRGVLLPGKEVPACFTYRASRSLLTVKLNKMHLPTSTKFKACILIVYKGEYESYFSFEKSMRVSCSISSKQNAITARTPHSKYSVHFPRDHLYIFDIEVDDVTPTELDFTFELISLDNWKKEEIIWDWEIKECGVLSVHGDSCYERFGGCKEICKRCRITPYSVKGVLSIVAILLFLILLKASDLMSDKFCK